MKITPLSANVPSGSSARTRIFEPDFFIIGGRYGGAALLGRMLDHAQNVSVLNELAVYDDFVAACAATGQSRGRGVAWDLPATGSRIAGEQAADFLARVADRVSFDASPVPDLVDGENGSIGVRALLDAAFQTMFERIGRCAALRGIRGPDDAQIAEWLGAIYADIKAVAIVRHPVGAIGHAVATGMNRDGALEAAIGGYRSETEKVVRGFEDREDVILVRYEDLVLDGESVVPAIVRFLGVEPVFANGAPDAEQISIDTSASQGSMHADDALDSDARSEIRRLFRPFIERYYADVIG